jgi:hypothetical protein
MVSFLFLGSAIVLMWMAFRLAAYQEIQRILMVLGAIACFIVGVVMAPWHITLGLTTLALISLLTTDSRWRLD